MRHGGFTLLEILVSVSLLAMLIALAYGSIRVATQGSRSGEALIERTEEMRSAQNFLRNQLSQMMASAYEYTPETGEEIRFHGERDAIQFVAPMPGYLSRGGAHVQRIELVDGPRGRQLQFTFAQLNGWDQERGFSSEIEPVVLIDGIQEGAFAFRFVDEQGELSDWTEEWETPSQLPLMISLDLDFDRDDPRRWPLFTTAALAAGGNPVMSFDSVRPRAPGFGAPPANPKPREAP